MDLPNKVIRRTIDKIVNKQGVTTTKIQETIEYFSPIRRPISYYIK